MKSAHLFTRAGRRSSLSFHLSLPTENDEELALNSDHFPGADKRHGRECRRFR